MWPSRESIKREKRRGISGKAVFKGWEAKFRPWKAAYKDKSGYCHENPENVSR